MPSSCFTRSSSQSGFRRALLRNDQRTASQGSTSCSRRERASAAALLVLVLQVIQKQKLERNSAQRAYLLLSFFIIIKYSRALQSVKTSAYQGLLYNSTRQWLNKRTIISISLSQISQLSSTRAIVLEKNTTRYYSPLGPSYENILATTPSNASISTLEGSSGSQCASTRAQTKRSFSSSKASR